MRTVILYNAVYPETVDLAERCLESFEPFSGWGHVEAFDGCSPMTLPQYDRKFGIRDTRMKRDLGQRYASKKSCFYSHFEQWIACVRDDAPMTIVEYDTTCVGDLVDFYPEGVTHLSIESICATGKYRARWPKDAAILADRDPGVHPLSMLTRQKRKRDMPSNTAYVITPRAADDLIADCVARGWKQNDNLMVDTLVPLWFASPSPIEYVESVDLHTSHYVAP